MISDDGLAEGEREGLAFAMALQSRLALERRGHNHDRVGLAASWDSMLVTSGLAPEVETVVGDLSLTAPQPPKPGSDYQSQTISNSIHELHPCPSQATHPTHQTHANSTKQPIGSAAALTFPPVWCPLWAPTKGLRKPGRPVLQPAQRPGKPPLTCDRVRRCRRASCQQDRWNRRRGEGGG